MQPTRMDDFPHVFIQLPESSCKMHIKQESVVGGHGMTNKKVSWVDMPWQNKKVSWVGMPWQTRKYHGWTCHGKTRKCHGWACHDGSHVINLLTNWIAKGTHVPHLCLESALEVPGKDRLNLRYPDSKLSLSSYQHLLLQGSMCQFCATRANVFFYWLHLCREFH